MFEQLRLAVVASGNSWDDFVFEHKDELLSIMVGIPTTEALANIDIETFPGLTPTIATVATDADVDNQETIARFFVTVDGTFTDTPTLTDQWFRTDTGLFQVYADVGGTPTWVEVNGDHTHTQAEIVGLAGALLLKADVTYVDAQVAALLDSAPGALDTLNELAASLGDDANFAGTMTTALATLTSNLGSLPTLNTTIKTSAVAAINELEAITPKFFLNAAGRVYNYSNQRWVTDSDDNYGSAYYQFAENCGTGTNPNIEWEHMGEYVRKGTKVHGLSIIGRSNTNTNFQDLEIYALYRRPNPISRWDATGFDNDNEDVVTDLYRDLWRTPVNGNGQVPFSAGTMADKYRRNYDLNFECPEDGYLSVYYKPVRGTIGSNTRYFIHQRSWCLSYS